MASQNSRNQCIPPNCEFDYEKTIIFSIIDIFRIFCQGRIYNGQYFSKQKKIGFFTEWKNRSCLKKYKILVGVTVTQCVEEGIFHK